VQDHLSGMFPVKYRWPVFALDATPLGDCRAIIDEEGKIRARAPKVSKCRHMPLDFSDDDRRERNGLFEVLPPRVPFPHLETQGSKLEPGVGVGGVFSSASANIRSASRKRICPP